MERAHAQEAPELTLEWRADPGCPDRAWAVARLGDRLGRPLAEHATTTLIVSARLSRTSSGFTLELSSRRMAAATLRSRAQGRASTTRAVHGERTLSDVRCDEIAQAAILVIALALEDQRQEPGPPPASPQSPSAPATEAGGPADEPRKQPSTVAVQPGSPPVKEPAIADAAGTTSSDSLAIRVAALIDYGFLPGIGLGPELAVAFIRRRLRVELAGFWLPSRATEAGDRGGVAVTLWALRPLGCAELGEPQRVGLGIALCVGLEVGRAKARGTDLSQPREPDWFYRSAWGSLRFVGRLAPRWALLLEPGIAIPLGRPRFVSETTANNSVTELHTPAIVAGRLSIGLETRF